MISRPVVGLIGAGMISNAHLPGLSRLADEVLIFSHDGAAEQAEAYGARAVDTLDELIGSVDIVDIVTPTHTHYELAKKCLLEGKDVILEKPLAIAPEQAADLVRIAREQGRQLYPAHVVRYMPPYVAAKSSADAGEIGTLAVLNFARAGAFPDRAWFADPELSGGVIMDLMIHDLDIARWIAGEVVSVSAAAVRRETEEGPVEAAHALLTHVSGAITQCTATWGPAHLPFQAGFRIAGTNGTLEYSSREEEQIEELLEIPDEKVPATPRVDDAEDPYARELADFLHADRGHAPSVTAEDGLTAVRLASAALTSARIGQPVAP